MPEFVRRGGGFLRREWPLCLVTVCSLYFIGGYSTPAERITGAIGLIGALFCLKRFGLDHCLWIYLLALILVLPSGITLEDARALREYWPLNTVTVPLIRGMANAVKGMLYAIPFSLIFVFTARRVSPLLQVPLCIFFLLLALRPLWSGLTVAVILPFVPCP